MSPISAAVTSVVESPRPPLAGAPSGIRRVRCRRHEAGRTPGVLLEHIGWKYERAKFRSRLAGRCTPFNYSAAVLALPSESRGRLEEASEMVQRAPQVIGSLIPRDLCDGMRLRKVGFAIDSPLEQTAFEPPVPSEQRRATIGCGR
jgi:hypothetical protein